MITIYAEGNEEIGLGHISRSSSLATHFENRDTAVKCIFNAAPEHISHFPLIENTVFGGKDLITKNDILITDCLDLNKADEEYFRSIGFTFLIQLNGDSPDYQSDFTLKEEDNFDLRILNPSILRRRPTKPTTKFKKVLIALGAADPIERSYDILEATKENDFGFEWSCTLGQAFSDQHRQKCKSFTHANLFDAPKNMIQLIKEHDIIITFGGITSYEAMCLGKAVICLETDHMQPYLTKMKTAKVIETAETTDQLFKLLTTSNFEELARNGFNLIDGKGAQRFIDTILERYKRHES